MRERLGNKRSILWAALPLGVLLTSCGPDTAPCSEQDISGWTTSEPATPVYCQSKLIGYSLDIDAGMTARTFQLKKSAPLLMSGLVFLSADVDNPAPEFGAIQRTVKISRGPAVYAESSGGLQTLKAQAIVSSASDPLVFDVTVSVPVGTHYIGQIRNLQF